MGTRQVELALALEPAWPWLALVATHAGTGAWPMAARTCVWQGARPPGSGISSAWLMADAGLCPGSRRLETFNLTSRQMSEKPRREQATAPPPPSSCDPARTPGCGLGHTWLRRAAVSEEQGGAANLVASLSGTVRGPWGPAARCCPLGPGWQLQPGSAWPPAGTA